MAMNLTRRDFAQLSALALDPSTLTWTLVFSTSGGWNQIGQIAVGTGSGIWMMQGLLPLDWEYSSRDPPCSINLRQVRSRDSLKVLGAPSSCLKSLYDKSAKGDKHAFSSIAPLEHAATHCSGELQPSENRREVSVLCESVVEVNEVDEFYNRDVKKKAPLPPEDRAFLNVRPARLQ